MKKKNAILFSKLCIKTNQKLFLIGILLVLIHTLRLLFFTRYFRLKYNLEKVRMQR